MEPTNNPPLTGKNIRACETCGKAYKARSASSKQRFCSKLCGGARLKNRITRTCVMCGAEKEIAASHAHRAKDFSCSQACSLAYRAAHPTLRSAAISKAVQNKWDTDTAWAAQRRADKAAAKRPAPVIDNTTSVPLVRHAYLNAKGKPCSHCKRMILDRPGATNKNWFCTYTCMGKWMAEHQRGTNHPRWTQAALVTCVHCKHTFERKRAFVRPKQNVYCGKQCRLAHQQSAAYNPTLPNTTLALRPDYALLCSKVAKLAAAGMHKASIAKTLGLSGNGLRTVLLDAGIKVTGTYTYKTGSENKIFQKRIPVQCEICSKKMMRAPWLVDGRKIFCSTKCLGAWRYKGEPGAYRGRTFKKQRALALERDNATCQLCEKFVGAKIDAHHIKPYRLFHDSERGRTWANRLANLVCLCRSCHLKVEGTTDKANLQTWKAHYAAHLVRRDALLERRGRARRIIKTPRPPEHM